MLLQVLQSVAYFSATPVFIFSANSRVGKGYNISAKMPSFNELVQS
jgi:hypothetical protein